MLCSREILSTLTIPVYIEEQTRSIIILCFIIRRLPLCIYNIHIYSKQILIEGVRGGKGNKQSSLIVVAHK